MNKLAQKLRRKEMNYKTSVLLEELRDVNDLDLQVKFTLAALDDLVQIAADNSLSKLSLLSELAYWNIEEAYYSEKI